MGFGEGSGRVRGGFWRGLGLVLGGFGRVLGRVWERFERILKGPGDILDTLGILCVGASATATLEVKL